MSSSGHMGTQTPGSSSWLLTPPSEREERIGLWVPQMTDLDKCAAGVGRLPFLLWPFFPFFSGLCGHEAISPSPFLLHEQVLGASIRLNFEIRGHELVDISL